ncbi:MAG: CRTAC1 family protein, partial [Planctomycetota bacterium]|nr:CRTAC1 family protein [Planctomycetota bacterium]
MIAATGVFTFAAIKVASGRNTDLADSSENVTSYMENSDAAAKSPIRFSEVSKALGIQMQHGPGKRGRNLPEDTGSGLAWGDPDNDGDWDLYVVNYPGPMNAELNVESQGSLGMNRLYRNDGGIFIDITEEAGVGDLNGFGMGASFVDYDGDGDVDIYVTNYGPNRLFENQGDCTFIEVSKRAGVDNPLWSTGAAWGDVDRDGDLDLYVCNYVEIIPSDPDMVASAEEEGLDEDIPISLNPNSFDPQPNAFYLNNGDGTFQDLAKETGILNPEGRSLEAIFCDLDGDGWLDLYVNNDVSTNKLYLSLGGGMETPLFADLSTQTGTADPRGSMGLGVAEFGDMAGNMDGLPDLFITHWLAQENALYQSLKGPGGDLEYRDKVQIFRLGEVSIGSVGWGTGLVDMDLDGQLDIVVTNGSTLEERNDKSVLVQESIFLFWNAGNIFHEVADWGGEVFENKYSGRGLAVADFDGDGDVDVALNVNRGAPLILQNDSETSNSSLTILLDAPAVLATGAKIEVLTAERRQIRWWLSESSFLSGHAPEQIYGLGAASQADKIIVHWA